MARRGCWPVARPTFGAADGTVWADLGHAGRRRKIASGAFLHLQCSFTGCSILRVAASFGAGRRVRSNPFPARDQVMPEGSNRLRALFSRLGRTMTPFRPELAVEALGYLGGSHITSAGCRRDDAGVVIVSAH